MKMTPAKVRGALLEQGFKSLSDWARKHGYSQQHVDSVLKRWCGRTSGFPRAGALRIVVSLSQTISKPITPVLKDFN
jgi:hypothetical protein